MRNFLMIAALLAASSVFASHNAKDAACTYKYNKCMANCSVVYGSNSECVNICNDNYSNCKAGAPEKVFFRDDMKKEGKPTPSHENKEHKSEH